MEMTKGMTNIFFSKFSNWKKLQKAVAWMLRYKEFIMRKAQKGDTDGDSMNRCGRNVESRMLHCVMHTRRMFSQRTWHVEVRSGS